MRKWQKIITFLWLATVVIFWSWVIYEEIDLSAQALANFLRRFQHYIVLTYTIFGILRAFTLIPNMTVVFVGSLLIHDFWVLLITSIIGLIGSSAIIYFFGEELGLKEILYKRFPDKIEFIRSGLERYGAIIIILWGFLPVVPSDLLSFFLGTIRFPFWQFVLYYTVGHLITYSFIILFGRQIWQLLL